MLIIGQKSYFLGPTKTSCALSKTATMGSKAAKAWSLARFWELESGGGSGTQAK